jgi:hypothetical protein
MLVEGVGDKLFNSIKYQRTSVHHQSLVQVIIDSDTHVIATPTIPTCLKTACVVHSLPGETAFHIDGYEYVPLLYAKYKILPQLTSI